MTIKKALLIGLLIIALSGPIYSLFTPPPTNTAQITATVTYVVDGDTLDVDQAGTRYRIRLLGIDAPELAHDGRPADCGAQAARDALTALADGQQITWEHDPRSDSTDRYGRVLAYAGTTQNPDLALELLDQGVANAWAPAGAQPTRHVLYQDAANAAHMLQRGSWTTCNQIGR